MSNSNDQDFPDRKSIVSNENDSDLSNKHIGVEAEKVTPSKVEKDSYFDDAVPSKKDIVKGGFKRVVLYLTLNLITLGLWSRFKPFRKGKKGGWGLTSFFFLIICAVLISERFFKVEVDNIIKSKLNEDISISQLYFLSDVEDSSKTEGNSKTEMESVDDIKLKGDYDALKNINTSLRNKILEYGTESSQKTERIGELEEALQATERKIAEVPNMSFLKLSELDSFVGCSSKYSESKKRVLFYTTYAFNWMSMPAKIVKIESDKLYLNADNVSLEVSLKEIDSGYNLLVDEIIAVTFKLTVSGTCDAPYQGVSAIFSPL